ALTSSTSSPWSSASRRLCSSRGRSTSWWKRSRRRPYRSAAVSRGHLAAELAVEPGARHRRVALDGAHRDPEHLGRLLHRQPGEEAQLDDARLLGAHALEP